MMSQPKLTIYLFVGFETSYNSLIRHHIILSLEKSNSFFRRVSNFYSFLIKQNIENIFSARKFNAILEAFYRRA